jgi:hypothetical protein
VRSLAIAAALCSAPLALVAQVTTHFSVGARYPGLLVHDSITTALDVRPTNGPAFALAFELAPYRRWSAGLTFDYSRSELRRQDDTGSVVNLGSLGALSVTVGLRRTLSQSLSAGFLAGWLRYFPSREEGLFRGGQGEVFPLLGLNAGWEPFWARARGFGFEARLDAHRFITETLQEHGFHGTRLARRLTLALRANLGRLR